MSSENGTASDLDHDWKKRILTIDHIQTGFGDELPERKPQNLSEILQQEPVSVLSTLRTERAALRLTEFLSASTLVDYLDSGINSQVRKSDENLNAINTSELKILGTAVLMQTFLYVLQIVRIFMKAAMLYL